MTTRENTEALLNAAQVAHAVAALLTASNDQHTCAATSARVLADQLAEAALQMFTLKLEAPLSQ